jgi:hypothetical protein
VATSHPRALSQSTLGPSLQLYQRQNGAAFLSALGDPALDLRQAVADRLGQIVEFALAEPYGPGRFVVHAVAERASSDDATGQRAATGFVAMKDEIATSSERAAATGR